MKKLDWLFVFFILFSWTGVALAQGTGRIEGKLEVGATPLATGELRIVEPLNTRDGAKLVPGVYRISIGLTNLGEAYFFITLPDPEQTTQTDLPKSALNRKRQINKPIEIRASILRNLLVTGIASIEGTFEVQPMTPTEAILTFNSKQFAASSVLGRSLDSKIVDLMPIHLSLDDVSSCGDGCVEAVVKVTIRNEGNSTASGKWNVMLVDPRFFIGVVSDLPSGEERVITSGRKVRLQCCGTTNLHAEVHPDFYNKTAIDANESNNSRRFTINLESR